MDAELERLVEELLPQARSEAWKIFASAPTQLDKDELVSLAYTGLAMAAAKWPDYCARNSFNEQAYHYFAAYALRRIRGSMLDAMRSADWVSRSVRSRAKALRAADPSDNKTEKQLSEDTGLTVRQIRDTITGVARRPVSMQAEPVDVPEDESVEGQVLVHAILGAAVDLIETFTEEEQIILALRYFRGMELKDIAGELNRTEPEVQAIHVKCIVAVREVMAGAAIETE